MHFPVPIEVFLQGNHGDLAAELSNKELRSKENHSNTGRKLEALHWETMFEGSSVDKRCNAFMNIYKELVEKMLSERQPGELPDLILCQ